MNTLLFKALKRTLFLLVVAVLVVGVIAAQLSHTEAADNSIVRIKLSIGTPTSFSFSLSGNYSIEGMGNVSLASGSYTVKIESGTLRLYNGSTLVASGSTIKIVELAPPSGSYNFASIKTTNYGTNNYRGSIEFRISSSAIVLINHIYIEYYLYGVVPHEMSNSWPIEALKAQAVTARTYAVRYMGSGTYDLIDTSANQVYKGFNPSHTNAIKAVDDTSRVVLKSGNELVQTYYAASNGGHVDIPQHVWSASAPLKPYHITMPDPYDTANTWSVQEVLIFPKAMSGSGGIKHQVMSSGSMVAGSTTRSGNAELYFKTSALPAVVAAGYIAGVTSDIEIQGVSRITPHTYAGNHGLPDATGGNNCIVFNRADVTMTVLAYRFASAAEQQQTGSAYVQEPVTVTFTISLDTLRSSSSSYRSFDNTSLRLFVVEESGSSWNIYNRRYGHGVGMSQRGAQTQAREGRTYQQILQFYYPNTTFDTLNIAPPGLAAPGSGSDTANATVVNCANYVNVRSTPDTQYAAIGRAFANSRITVTQPFVNAEWHKIDFGGLEAYIFAYYVQIDAEPTPPPTEPPAETETPEPTPEPVETPQPPPEKPGIQQNGTVSVSTLNVRTGPGTTHTVLGQFTRNNSVEIVEAYASPEWHKIWHNEQIAYVFANYVKLQNEIKIEATGVITSSVLNIRSGAGTSFAVLGQFKKGDKVSIITVSAEKDWHKILHNGSAAFVHASYVRIDGASGESPPSGGSSGGTPAAVYATVNANKLNLRQGANTSSRIINTLSRGDVVQVLEQGGEWHKVRYGGTEGYMFAQYLKTSSAVFGTVNASVLNVRSGASTSSAVLGKLSRNDVVEVTQKGGTWHKIKYKTSTAYVYAQYIKLP